MKLNYASLIPEIFVHDGPAAMEFYKQAFGASETSRLMTNDGKKMVHGELMINGHHLFVCDEFDAREGGTCRSPTTLGGTPLRLTLLVADVDSACTQAMASGATLLLAPQDTFWGARYAKLRDPFGHEWGINQQKIEQTEAETDAAARAYFATKSQQ